MMVYDWNFSRYTIEEMNTMREQRKLEAERKREQSSKDLTPHLIQFERLLMETD